MTLSLRQPEDPVRVAVIGTGARTQTQYAPLFPSLRRWIEVVAVCDPVKANADNLASILDVPAYYDIHQLVKDRSMEAALIITPADSHHSISVCLSSHGIHNMAETPWAGLLSQARDMIDTAERNGVVVRVAENFFRFPVDRFAQVLKESGYIGKIERIFSYNDHPGYHNNSRWIRFAGAHPLWVQGMHHRMETAEFHSMAHRFHQSETFHSCTFAFPDNLIVIDQASNCKSLLGRQTRPGYTEWHGACGTLVHRGSAPTKSPATYYRDGRITVVSERAPLLEDTELRFCSAESLAKPGGGGCADHISQVVNDYEGHNWVSTWADTANGRMEYRNPYRSERPSKHRLREYGASIMNHIVDFALAVRGLAKSEFSAEDALMSLMMLVGTEESALREGRRIALPLSEDLQAEELNRDHMRRRWGVDPLDVEGMLAISYPRQ